MFQQKNKSTNKIDTLIGPKTRIEGNLIFSGGLRVDGFISGNVIAESDKDSTLVVSAQAKIAGEVRVSHLVINGEIDGPVHVSHFVELQPKARLIGDLHYRQLEMHAGAVVDGKLIPIGEVKLLSQDKKPE